MDKIANFLLYIITGILSTGGIFIASIHSTTHNEDHLLKKIKHFLLNLSKTNKSHNNKYSYPLSLEVISFMTQLITFPLQAMTVLEEVAKFRQYTPHKQEKELPRIYLTLEQYIVEVDPLKKYSRATLRKQLSSLFPAIHEIPPLAFIFNEKVDTKEYLCRLFLIHLITIAEKTLGYSNGKHFHELKEWLKTFPHSAHPAPFNLSLPKQLSQETILPLMSHISSHLFAKIESLKGTEISLLIWGNVYHEFSHIYGGLDTFPVIVHLLPNKLLDDTKLRLLSRVQLEESLLKHTQDLATLNQQLIQKNEELHAMQTALWEAKAAELETHKLMATILETVGECIITIDSNSNIVMSNREAEKMLGYGIGELQNQPIDIIMPAEFKEQHHKGLANYLNTGNSNILGKWMRFTACHKDGTIFPVELKVMETCIGDKRLFTVALHDMTDRIHQESLLKQKNDELDMLVYKTSHDLRGPITSILGLTQLIEANPNDSPSYMKLIEKSLHKLDETIQDLMQFGQLSNPNLVSDVVHLYDVFQEVIDAIRHVSGFNEVDINLDFDPSITIISKKSLLKSIFQNLIANSVNYRRKGIDSFIQIRITIDKEMIISFEDNGQGIAERFQPKIFDMFFRANSKTKGTGLGLYIVKKSAETLGGSISLVSKVNLGTTFYLTLPIPISH